MRIPRGRLAVLLIGDRLVAAAVHRQRVETFTVEAENLAQALRAELDQRRLSPRLVALGLPRSAATVKPIDLPAVPGEMREMVSFELERHLPYPSDDAAFDFVALPAERGATGPRAETPSRRVLVVAAERRTVERALRVAEEARLRPASMTVAAHDLLALVSTPRRGRIVWVHRTDAGAELLFVAGGSLVLSRATAAADAATIAAEIRRSFTVTRWGACDAVWISGRVGDEAEALSGLAPVGEPPWTARARRLLQQAAEAPPGVTELALAVAVAPRARTLDLLPPALRPRRLTRAQAASAALLAATAGLAIAALLVSGYRESRRLALINTRIARLEGEVRSVEQVLKELERKRRLLATVETVQKTTVRPLPVLREMTELLPGDVWLTTLSLDVKGVELTGQAAAAAALIPLLENSPRFERVEFASPVTRGRDREQFRIRAAWEGGVAAASARAAAAIAPPQAAGPPAVTPPTAAAPARIPQLPAAPAAPGPAPAGPRSAPR